MSRENIQDIQRNVTIGSRVLIYGEGDIQVQGILAEISLDSIRIIDDKGRSSRIPAGIIKGYLHLDGESPVEIPGPKATSLEIETTLPPETEGAPVTASANGSELQKKEVAPPVSKPNPQVQLLLTELEVGIAPRVEHSTLEMPELDFDGLHEAYKKDRKLQSKVHEIRQTYEHARRNRELSSKYGRITPIVLRLRSLIQNYPRDPELYNLLGYFLYLERKYQEATDAFSEAYLLADRDKSRFLINAVVAAEGLDNAFPVIYFLERFFRKEFINEENFHFWYVFLRTLLAENHFQPLADLVEEKEDEEELDIIYRALIFLLWKREGRESTQAILKKTLPGEDAAERCRKVLDESEAGNYVSDGYITFKYKKDEIWMTSEPQAPGKDGSSDEDLVIPEGTFRGVIDEYHKEKEWGWIKNEQNEGKFFHISSVRDKEFRTELTDGNGLGREVDFEMGKGKNSGTLAAVNIYPVRSISELYDLAIKMYDEGNSHLGIYYIKKVLELDNNYKDAQEVRDRLVKFEQERTKPKGKDPYSVAKRADLDGLPTEEVIALYREAIEKDVKKESAIKDLASYLNQKDRTEEAIQLLESNMKEVRSQDSIKSMLVQYYFKTKRIEPYIVLLEEKAEKVRSNQEKGNIWQQIGNGYVRVENYREAIRAFEKVLELNPGNTKVKFNLALTYSRVKKYRKAKEYLREIQSRSPNIQAAQLEEQIKSAIETSTEVNFELFSDAAFQDTAASVSEFSRFYLDRIDLRSLVTRLGSLDENGKYVEEDHKYVNADLKQAEKFAKEQSTKRPKPRGEYYLMAAKILSDLEKDYDRLFSFLGRAMASFGDDVLFSKVPLDTMRQWYIEAASVFDKVEKPDDQDVTTSIIRFIHSTLENRADIPTEVQGLRIADALDEVVNIHPNTDKFFDTITHLLVQSELAQKRVLKPMWDNATCRTEMSKYFERKFDIDKNEIKSFEDSVRKGWSKVAHTYLENYRKIKLALDDLDSFEESPHWFNRCIETLKKIANNRYLPELDRKRIANIISILTRGIKYFEANVYSIQDSILDEMIKESRSLNREIEASPTRLGVEQMHPVVEGLIMELDRLKDDLYKKALPEVNLKVQDENHYFRPDEKQEIKVDVTITNRKGRSAAQEIELTIHTNENAPFERPKENPYRLTGVLEGGKENYINIPLKLKQSTIEKGAFSLDVSYTYRTVRGDQKGPFSDSFQITLNLQDDFEKIDNPYNVGGVVQENMFYGREGLISEIATKLQSFRQKPQGDAYLIYGQKRTGKSSLLFYLKKELAKDENNIIAYIDNLGAILGGDDPFAAFLWEILKKIRKGLRKLGDEVAAKWELPDRRKFFKDADYVSFFNDILDNLKDLKEETPELENKQVILLIDEFTYFYKEIKEGNVNDNLMKMFKAFLQKNYFNAVLVGQDYALKFIEQYQNEYAAIEKRKITYLVEKDARDLIETPILWNGKSRYAEETAINRILDLTANSPFYIQIISKQIVEYLNDRRVPVITGAIVKQVTDLLTKDPKKSLTTGEFDNLYNSEDVSDDAIDPQEALKVLYDIARNSQTGACSLGAIKCETTKHSIKEIIESLLRRDVLEQDKDRENFFRIKVGLFQEWLIANYVSIDHEEQ